MLLFWRSSAHYKSYLISFFVPTSLILLLCRSSCLAFTCTQHVVGDPVKHPCLSALNTNEGSSLRRIVALTREEGKNDKLYEALQKHPRMVDGIKADDAAIEVVEIPCIQHSHGPDTDILSPTLESTVYDYVTITSPEAANVFAKAWERSKRPPLGKIAAVGKATEKTLISLGLAVDFVPSKATAEVLCLELPLAEAEARSVLYPASAKAKATLQSGLEKRGFHVTRLNTYNTLPAIWDTDQVDIARATDVVCFASPSAVRAWVDNQRGSCEFIPAACIGETSAQACREMGWDEQKIFYPEKPGVQGWADAVADALTSLQKG